EIAGFGGGPGVTHLHVGVVGSLAEQHFGALAQRQSGGIPVDRLDAADVTRHRAAQSRASRSHGDCELAREVPLRPSEPAWARGTSAMAIAAARTRIRMRDVRPLRADCFMRSMGR